MMFEGMFSPVILTETAMLEPLGDSCRTSRPRRAARLIYESGVCLGGLCAEWETLGECTGFDVCGLCRDYEQDGKSHCKAGGHDFKAQRVRSCRLSVKTSKPGGGLN